MLSLISIQIGQVMCCVPPCNDVMNYALATCKPTGRQFHTSTVTFPTLPIQAFTPTSHSSPHFDLSTRDSHVAFPRELTTASRLPHSNKTEQQGGNHNPSTTPTLLQPMPACAAAAYMAYTMRARADMDAVQCY